MTMKTIISKFLLVFAVIIIANQVNAQTEESKHRPFHMSFLYPLSTDGVNSKDYSYNFSLNILGGVTGGLNGAEFGGLFNINLNQTNGAQFAGIFNKANKLTGAQFAGIGNISNYNNSATQFGGIFNFSPKGTSLAQFAGIANVADSSIFQFGGIANVSDDVTCQVGGIVNLARKSKVQIGLINVSDSANIMIGLVNIAKNGFMEVEVAGGEFIHTAVSFRSGTKKFYGIASLGYNFSDNFWAYGAGFGTTVELSNKLGFNFEAVHYMLVKKFFEGDRKYNGLAQLRPLLYYKVSKKFKVFAGPVANLYMGSNSEENNLKISAPYTFWDDTDGKTKLEAWVGFTAGIRVCF